MRIVMFMEQAAILLRREEGAGGGLGCFLGLVGVGVVAFLLLRGKRDREEQLGAAHRPLGSGPVEGITFACPYPKCTACGASGDRMKQAYDGLRKVTWTCGYCGATAGVQELADAELPGSARQRLGLDAPLGGVQGQGYPSQGGDLLAGMVIGSMLSGSHHEPGREIWGGGASPEPGEGGGDWSAGDDGGSGGDFGDSGGGDF